MFADERVGNLCYVAKHSESLNAIRTQMDLIVRQTWSNSPNQGSRVVATVLKNHPLMTEWSVNNIWVDIQVAGKILLGLYLRNHKG